MTFYQSNPYGCLQNVTFNLNDIEQYTTHFQFNSEKTSIQVILNDQEGLAYYDTIDNMPDNCHQPINGNLDPIANFNYLWHSVAHLYSGFETKAIDWQLVYQNYQIQVTNTTTNEALFTVFSKMLSELKDSQISLTDNTNQRYFNQAIQSDFQRFIQARVYEANIAGRLNDPNAQAALIDRQTQAYQHAITAYLDGIEFNQYPNNSENPAIQWAVNQKKIAFITIEHLDVPPEQLNQIMSDISASQALILDVRESQISHTDHALRLAGYFTNEAQTVLTRLADNNDGIGQQQTLQIEPSDQYYPQPIFVITNQSNKAATEILITAIDALPQSQLIGQQSTGSLSQPHQLALPNEWILTLPNQSVFNALGNPLHMRGITPNHYTNSFKVSDLTFGRISAYETALNEINTQAPSYTLEQLQTDIDNIITQANIKGISISAVNEQGITWQYSYGVSDEIDTPVTADTSFTLASLTKPVAGTLLAHLLVDQNQLTLSTPITNELLGFELAPNTPEFNLTHIATFSAPIKDSPSYYCAFIKSQDQTPLVPNIFPGFECEKELHTINTYVPSYFNEQGSNYSALNYINQADYQANQSFYSNMSTGLAGYVMDSQLNQLNSSIEQYSASRLFEPLNMMSTAWRSTDLPQGHQVAKPFELLNGEPTWMPYYESAALIDGSLVSSANDMSNFLLAVLNQGNIDGIQVLDAQAIELMLTPQSENMGSASLHYGLFWNIDDHYLTHFGADLGVLSNMIADIEKKIGLVTLATAPLYDPRNPQAMEAIKKAVWRYLNQ